jgi:flagella basal body P-ring formation protein FlgA
LSIFAPQQIVLISARGQLRRQWINRIKAEYLKACSECQVEVELTQFPSDLDPQKVSLPTQALRWNQQFTIPLSSGALIGHSKILRAQFVLQAPVAQGERISESQLAKELRPFHPQARTLDLSRLPYSLARKALSMGAVITDVELMPEVLVRRGDLVKVVLGGAGFQVQIDAVSEGQGGFGDQVQVRNPQTRTLLSGTIYERGKVRVQ